MSKWCSGKKKCIRESVNTISHVKWLEPINLGIRFSVLPKRFLPFLFSDIAAMLVIVMIMANNSTLMDMVYSGAAIPAESIPILGWSVLAFGAWMLVNIWITGAIVHQTKNVNEYRKSWQVAFKKLPALILALIVISVLSFAVSSVPYAGTLLSFLVAMSFLFVNQFIILDGVNFSRSLRCSALTFKNKIFAVFVAWMVSVIFATLIISVFTIPLFTTFFLFGSEYGEEDLMTSVMMNPGAPWLFVSGFILMLGVAISRVFALKYLTEVYLQFKKKKWLFF